MHLSQKEKSSNWQYSVVSWKIKVRKTRNEETKRSVVSLVVDSVSNSFHYGFGFQNHYSLVIISLKRRQNLCYLGLFLWAIVSFGVLRKQLLAFSF